MIFFYRVLYFILKSLALVLRPVLPADLQSWIQLRQKSFRLDTPLQNTIWFHASSGEIEYCKFIIRQMKNKNPQSSIVVTYSSPSAEKLFQNIADVVDIFAPLSWDSPTGVHKMLHFLNPKLMVFSRTDLWPELITQAHQRKIPLALVAFNPQMQSASVLKRFTYRWLLKSFSYVSCVEHQDALALQTLLQIPTTQIRADGDTRFDQVFHRLEQPSKIDIASTEKIFVLGSTWPQDEAVWLPVLPLLRDDHIKVILSPHHVGADSIQQISHKLKQHGLLFETLTAAQQAMKKNKAESEPAGATSSVSINRDVLLIDQIGVLADCYRFASAAFVGGSFKDKVHSVMEPLCCGLHVMVGPYHENNPEALRYRGQFVTDLGAASKIIPAELAQLVRKQIFLPKERVSAEMQKNRHASDKVSAYLTDMILKNVNF